MEDFVRIRVTDAAEQVRIGQSALQGVVVLPERTRERVASRLEDINPARIVPLECFRTADDEERRLTLRAGFSQDERSVTEVDGEETDLARNTCAGFLPSQTAGNHQMENEKQIAVQCKDDPLSQPVQRHDRSTLDDRQWRIDGAKEKGGGESNLLDTAADDARREGMQVKKDVRQLWHVDSLHENRYLRDLATGITRPNEVLAARERPRQAVLACRFSE